MAIADKALFGIWPFNLLLDVFYKEEIAERAYIPAVVPTVRELPDQSMADIIIWRYRDGMKLQQIGAKLGLSSERVRQIQTSGLAKLRHPTMSVKLLTVSPAEAAALNRRIRELTRACGEDAPEPDMNELNTDSPIEALNLSTRSYNGLRRLGVRMAGDLKDVDAASMLRVPGMGLKSIKEIAAAIEPAGVHMDLSGLPAPNGKGGGAHG